MTPKTSPAQHGMEVLSGSRDGHHHGGLLCVDVQGTHVSPALSVPRIRQFIQILFSSFFLYQTVPAIPFLILIMCFSDSVRAGVPARECVRSLSDVGQV